MGSCPTPELVELLQVHEVVDAGEEQPLPASQPADDRMVQRAGIELMAVDRAGDPLDDALAPFDLPDEIGARRARGPWHARDDGGGTGRPAIRGGARCREDEAGASARIVSDRLGDIPV